MPNCKQCPKFLLFVLWIVLTGGILAIIGLFFISGNGRQAFAVIVDAGSTSSKISVITWRDWPFRTNEWVEEINYTIVEPGISAYAEDPEEASDRLVPVLQQVLSNHVPALESAKTSLYLAATAGMRLLDLNNPLKSAEIVESLRQTLPNIGAVVHNVFSDIRIISGSTEGRYGWVAANYLDRKLGDPSGLPPESGDKMSGMLDLGGASTQIAFVPEEGRPAPHISSINLFGATYDVYSYSFLCFGKEAFTRRYLARRIALTSNVSSGTVHSACHLAGYQVDLDANDIFAPPCVTTQFADELTGLEIVPPEDLPRTVTLVGTGQHTECREEVAKLFPSKACSHNSCSFMNVSQPSPRGKFFVEKEYPSNELKYVAGYCFDGIYIDSLLDGYGFSEDSSWKNIEFVNTIANTSASWALGYIVDATGHIETIPSKADRFEMLLVVSMVALALAWLISLIGLLCSAGWRTEFIIGRQQPKQDLH